MSTMKSQMGYTQTVADAARRLGVSVDRVRQLDHALKPIRVGSSRIRLYNPSDVDAFAKAREARRAG